MYNLFHNLLLGSVKEARKKETVAQSQSNLSSDEEPPIRKRKILNYKNIAEGKMKNENAKINSSGTFDKPPNNVDKIKTINAEGKTKNVNVKLNSNSIASVVNETNEDLNMNKSVTIEKPSNNVCKIKTTATDAEGKIKNGNLKSKPNGPIKKRSNPYDLIKHKNTLATTFAQSKQTGASNGFLLQKRNDKNESFGEKEISLATNDNMNSKIDELKKIIEVGFEGTKAALKSISIDVKCIKSKMFNEMPITNKAKSFPIRDLESFKLFDEKLKSKKYSEKVVSETIYLNYIIIWYVYTNQLLSRLFK